MTDHITFQCAKCGSERFHVPTDPGADDLIKCVRCGAWARYEEVRNVAIEEAKKTVEDAIRNAFKGNNGFTPD